MKQLDFKELEDFSIKMALYAGRIVLKHRKSISIVTKKMHSLDFATTADIASEKYLRKEIGKKFPLHGILGEEGGETRVDSDYTWILDPLDGTLDYKRGLSSFNVHIALEHNGVLIIGCIHRPMTGEFFSSFKGGGTRKTHVSVRVSNVRSLEKSIVRMKLPRVTTGQAELERSLSILHSLAQRTGLIRGGFQDGMSLAEIASGSTEGLVVPRIGPKWWDVAAGILMVEEAGGKVTDLGGEPIKNRDLSHGIVASNGKIHEELLHLIRT